MPPGTGLFKVIEVSSTKSIIQEDGIRKTVSLSLYRATLKLSAKFADLQIVYKPDQQVSRRDDRVFKGAGQTIAEEFTDTPCKEPIHQVLLHVDGGYVDRYFVRCWYSCTPVEDMDEHLEHIPKHFITRY